MSDRVMGLVVGALLVLAGVWAGVRWHQSSHPPGLAGGIPVPVGEASAPTASDLADQPLMPPAVKIPDQLPDFSLQSLEGKLTSIKSWSGQALVINFWATWCAPCRQEIPLLETLSNQWASRGFTFVGVAVDHREQVRSYAQELKIPYPLLIGEQDALDAASRLGVDTPVFPFTVFTDRRGEVVALYVGELHPSQADLILSTVQDLDHDHIALHQARHAIAEGLRALSSNPDKSAHNS